MHFEVFGEDPLVRTLVLSANGSIRFPRASTVSENLDFGLAT